MLQDYLSKLNEFQLDAVYDESDACLVNANVGSGKTTVLISKVFYLYDQKDIPLNKMVVLTFTNKAANEIKERMLSSNPSLQEDDMPYFGTFHSVALKMLKSILPIDKLGFTSDFSVIDPDEESKLAESIIVENNLRILYKNKLPSRIEKARKGKNSFGSMKKTDDIQELLKLLVVEKKRQNKLSFDDLLNYTIDLLQDFSFDPEWIIVDEFQDSNETQLELIESLKGNSTKLFAVGDPNQVIYTWRGSQKDIFSTFQKTYNATVYSLPVNYRSCNNILDVAKCFVENKEDLTGTRGNGNKVIVKKHYDSFNEAQYLVEEIQKIVKNGDCYNDIAILYRMQSQSQVIADTFNRAAIPFSISQRKTVKDIPVLSWLTSVFKFCINHKDKNNAFLALSNSKYGEKLSDFEARLIVNGNNEHVSEFYNRMIGFSANRDSFFTTKDIYDYLQIDKMIIPTSASFAQDKEYVDSLLLHISDYAEKNELNIYDGLKEYIDSSALFGIDFLKNDNAISENSVNLMTLHASKGLEFKYVYIIGANQGVIPLRGTRYNEDEEEKRLFFVGVTRAKDNLEISYYTNPNLHFAFGEPSYFISLIPSNLIIREDKSSESTSLQDLRHAIKQTHDKSGNALKERKVRHPKYGEGVIQDETDEIYIVSFEGYGKKEFFKLFNDLEIIG